MTRTLDELLSESIFDSRDLIERLHELRDTEDRDEMENAELAELEAINEEGEGYAPDWTYGEGLIDESYFEAYAQELAEDIGAINRDASWPLSYIYWPAAADALKMDYTGIDIRGRTWYVR
ncbi:MAG: hypothetical protein IT345_10725 [Trueperaceae bacterium]|nr:hypothetical protein [Trueperaceae bacterium]